MPDYQLLPHLKFGQPRIHLADQNPIQFESYRFDTLDFHNGVAERDSSKTSSVNAGQQPGEIRMVPSPRLP